jgi:hypothetical protein
MRGPTLAGLGLRDPEQGQETMMQNNEFAVQVHRDGNAWAWKVLDENGLATSRGKSGSPQEAQRAAMVTAGSLNRFRAVTRGGW